MQRTIALKTIASTSAGVPVNSDFVASSVAFTNALDDFYISLVLTSDGLCGRYFPLKEREFYILTIPIACQQAFLTYRYHFRLERCRLVSQTTPMAA
jgi:hypothetical protein